MKRQATEAQKQAAQARREKFRALSKQIADMTEEQRLAFAAKLPVIVTVEGRVLSGHNMMMLAFQFPAVTVVGGFRQWIKAGRCVKKGEHGLAIWCRTGNKESQNLDALEASNKETPTDTDGRFIMGTVFDVSQTIELGTEQPEPTTAAMPTPAYS